MGRKLADEFDQLRKKNVPGPGTYNFTGADMKKTGSYFLSTHRNNLSPRYYNQPEKSSKFKTVRESLLGPGECTCLRI